MFGNSGYSWKLTAALGLFGSACVLSQFLGQWINPSPWLAEQYPERYDGRTLWIPVSEVVDVGESGFTIMFGERRVAIRGKPEWIRLGDWVELTGEYAHPGALRLARARRFEIPWWRHAANLVSVAVLIALVWLFSRRFRIRPGAWELRWPTS